MSALNNAGITYSDPGRAVGAGKVVCGLFDNGAKATEVVKVLMDANPELSLEHGARFEGIAVSVYCPQHLAEANR